MSTACSDEAQSECLFLVFRDEVLQPGYVPRPAGNQRPFEATRWRSKRQRLKQVVFRFENAKAGSLVNVRLEKIRQAQQEFDAILPLRFSGLVMCAGIDHVHPNEMGQHHERGDLCLCRGQAKLTINGGNDF